MLYRNENDDLIYRRESDGKLFLLMEGVEAGVKGKLSYDVLIVFEYSEGEEQDLGNVVTWLYGAAFADSDDTLEFLRRRIG